MKKPSLLLLLLSFFLFTFFLGCATGKTGDNSVKVLTIGNSFSISLMKYMPAVADSLALDLDLHSLYIGGCSMKRHMDNVKRAGRKDFRPYSYNRNLRGKAFPKKSVNLTDILNGEVKFDIITVQQASHESWNPECYRPWGDDLVKLIRETQPQAKIYVQETWSYTPWEKRLATWGFDQDGMYDRLHAAYAEFAQRNGLEIIPMGTAVRRWRKELPVRYGEKTFGGDVVGGRGQREEDQFKRTADNRWEPNCDLSHLNDAGEYLQALVWTAKLFNEDVSECEFRPESVSEERARLMKSIAVELAK